jgi:hypothetical protein
MSAVLAIVTAEQISKWPEGAQIAFLAAQIIAGVGWLYFLWLFWACERDLKKLREAIKRERGQS